MSSTQRGPTLPTLNFKGTRHSGHEGSQGSQTQRHGYNRHGEKGARYGDVKPHPPAAPRQRWAGATEGIPATARPTKSTYGSKHNQKNAPSDHHPKGALTARPPTGEKSGRQHHRGNAVRPHHVEQLKSPGGPDLPMTPAKALKNHRDQLSQYEQGEILDYPQVCEPWTPGAHPWLGLGLIAIYCPRCANSVCPMPAGVVPR